ncbi:MAG: hypothetical protein IKU25_02205 [Clostridia bacterium]|nr:hypothetical protein [Clostridia bacterium]
MKFKGVICAVLVLAILVVAGCSVNDVDPTSSTTTNGTTVPNTQITTTVTTTTSGSEEGTSDSGQTTTTTSPSDTSTTTVDGVIPPTISNQAPITIQEISVNGLPVIVGDRTNRLRINAAGLLDGNSKNPLFILVTNVGEDDIYSATINANAGGKEVCFNISYLPRGASIWAESVDNYIYSASDKFIVRTDAIIVSASLAGVPVDTGYSGILKLYAGDKNGSRGLFIENVSGKKISKVVIKYRPHISEAGLFATPYVLELTDVESGSKYFKPNAYLYGVDIADVQVTY